MADETTSARAPSDPLKWYCVIFLVLVVLLGVMWFVRRGDRKALEQANAVAATWMNPARDMQRDRPIDIPSLAFEVEQYAEAFEASGGESASEISLEKMDALITHANLTRQNVQNPPVDQNRSRGYQTIAKGFEFAPGATLENLVVLAFNVEQKTRYRVMEMEWTLLSEKDGNNVAPFHKIGRSRMKVAMRQALRKDS